MPTSTTSRAEARARTQERILELGRDHLARYGAAALSLRAIARDLDMVSSAVYRYVANRDELLTLLVVDAYTEQADRVTEAHTSVPDNNFRGQLLAMCQAFREWGVAEPSRYALIFGSPVPGYQAPGEQTTEPGTRVIGLLLRTFSAAAAAGHLPQQEPSDVDATLIDFDTIQDAFDVTLDEPQIHSALSLWALLVGLTSLEVFGQFGAEPPFDLQVLFTQQIEGQLDRIGLNRT
jgi:AcrR family transcriptional regulator